MAVAATVSAQTAPTAKKTTTTVHHATTAKSTATAPATATSAENPPNIPKVEGAPKDMYTMRYADITIGTGELAKPNQFYTVQYTGWLTDGTKFDSSLDRGQPFTFRVGGRQVIEGWDTGFEGMHVGGKRRLYIPYQLGYGELGRPPQIPPKAELIFDIELVSQSERPPLPPARPIPPPVNPSQNRPATPPHPAAAGATGAASQPATPAPTPADATKPQTQPETH